MKKMLVFMALAAGLSALINYSFVEWTRNALINSSLVVLPLPAFTRAVFGIRLWFFLPICLPIFALVELVRFQKNDSSFAVFASGFTLFFIACGQGLVGLACILPWIPRIP